MSRKIVSVYGGSAPQPGSAVYQEAEHLGRLLAEAGYTVATGGYGGTMGAASQGAAEAGGHVIGVTSEVFDNWKGRENTVNQWVAEEIKLPTLRERLYHLISFCDAAVALPGGIGTLAEVAMTWNLMQLEEIERKPFFLLGKELGDMLTGYYGNGDYINEKNMHLWQAVETPQQVIAALAEWLKR